ncbi:MAG: hypothetical protein B7Z60_05800 [Ferrovum sp. 37-45-19]|uniref:BON domain-containing protein n=1 Tax=Ferrovum sp. JA12 TaxID=1356299 RepID=UPI0007029739|nr:BON domain-containing protein [Ferrovum sp. JA12]OYV79501.1 MAG: hypothetical protein B7Z65_05955 [Ferrovum sp. 21-44-67]OYV94244.1 MAG: hypothetical protein B7Z60_05800 [Ferrovum sp. 37-45-19]OZB31724.1 MAG: hypothetical protein B7X47_08725 [Ferrovum sp. 34-44-207]HQT81718.1 BON domain-containing protein [Ferrovaceae bacterium]KRH78342.1 BON domain protein [Ferrovum sp. JA12]
MKKTTNITLSLGLMTLLLLSACATPAPYTAAEESNDQKIKDQVLEKFKHEQYTFLGHVDITVYKSTVILGGLVFEPVDRDVALRDARSVQGVKAVNDQIEIESNAY